MRLETTKDPYATGDSPTMVEPVLSKEDWKIIDKRLEQRAKVAEESHEAFNKLFDESPFIQRAEFNKKQFIDDARQEEVEKRENELMSYLDPLA